MDRRSLSSDQVQLMIKKLNPFFNKDFANDPVSEKKYKIRVTGKYQEKADKTKEPVFQLMTDYYEELLKVRDGNTPYFRITLQEVTSEDVIGGGMRSAVPFNIFYNTDPEIFGQIKKRIDMGKDKGYTFLYNTPDGLPVIELIDNFTGLVIPMSTPPTYMRDTKAPLNGPFKPMVAHTKDPLTGKLEAVKAVRTKFPVVITHEDISNPLAVAEAVFRREVLPFLQNEEEVVRVLGIEIETKKEPRGKTEEDLANEAAQAAAVEEAADDLASKMP